MVLACIFATVLAGIFATVNGISSSKSHSTDYFDYFKRIITMKKYLAATIIALGISGAAQAGVINGGFETGDLTGWASSLSGGSATVVTSYSTDYSPGNWYGTPVVTNPVEGSYMLAIESGDADIWQEATQAITLGAGDTLSGSAFFDWGDYWVDVNEYQDGARVQIRDDMGAVVATPFDLDGTDFCLTYCDSETGQAGAESGWIDWSFTTVTAGTYTLAYGARNTGDGGGPNPTMGYFDATEILAEVPEPTSLALMGLGLVGLGFRRRKAA